MRSRSSVPHRLLVVLGVLLLALLVLAALATRAGGAAASAAPPVAARRADELGRIPNLVHHELGDGKRRWGGTARSPFDPAFGPLRLPRVQVTGDLLERTLDRLDREGRYVSDGDPGTIAGLDRRAPLEAPAMRGGAIAAGGAGNRPLHSARPEVSP